MPNKRIFVKNQRKDGKLTVEYVFPINGTRLTKIITVEKLAAEREKGYDVYGFELKYF